MFGLRLARMSGMHQCVPAASAHLRLVLEPDLVLHVLHLGLVLDVVALLVLQLHLVQLVLLLPRHASGSAQFPPSSYSAWPGGLVAGGHFLSVFVSWR